MSPSVTVLVNGGQIAFEDVARSVHVKVDYKTNRSLDLDKT
jgi:hypothetical protein